VPTWGGFNIASGVLPIPASTVSVEVQMAVVTVDGTPGTATVTCPVHGESAVADCSGIQVEAAFPRVGGTLIVTLGELSTHL
jgi:hypothetical protein